MYEAAADLVRSDSGNKTFHQRDVRRNACRGPIQRGLHGKMGALEVSPADVGL